MILALLLAAAPVVHYAEFTGSVDPGSGSYLISAIRDAQEKGALSARAGKKADAA